MFKKSVDKSDIFKKLSAFTSIVEENLEYVLRLISMLNDPAVKYKNEDSSGKLAKLKTDIKTDTLYYPPEDIIKIITFTTLLESVYNSTNEIKNHIKELVKYPPINFDLSEIAIKISGIAKKAIDGFFSCNIDADLETEIIEAERLINAALRQLHKLNSKETQEKGRIVYYSCIVAALKEISGEASSLRLAPVPPLA